MKILGLEGREERVESRWLGIATSFVTLGWLPPPQGEEGGKHTKRERERGRGTKESVLLRYSRKEWEDRGRFEKGLSRGRRGMLVRCNGYEGGPTRRPVVGIVEEREQVEGQLEEGEGG